MWHERWRVLRHVHAIHTGHVAFRGLARHAVTAERYRALRGTWPKAERDIDPAGRELPDSPFTGGRGSSPAMAPLRRSYASGASRARRVRHTLGCCTDDVRADRFPEGRKGASEIEVQDIGTQTSTHKHACWHVLGVMCTNLMHSDLVPRWWASSRTRWQPNHEKKGMGDSIRPTERSRRWTTRAPGASSTGLVAQRGRSRATRWTMTHSLFRKGHYDGRTK